MNNKITLNFNCVLVMSFAAAIYGFKLYPQSTSNLQIKQQEQCTLFREEDLAFAPMILLKKNSQVPYHQVLQAVIFFLMGS